MAWQQLIPVVGVAFLVFLAWRLGTLKSAHLQDEQSVRVRFAQDFPDLRPDHVILSTDGRAALLVFEGDKLGAVFSVGDRFATRLFRPGDLEESVSDSGDMSIRTSDITIPYLNIKGIKSGDLNTLCHSLVIKGNTS